MENSEENNQNYSEQFNTLPEVIETILFKKVESKFTRLFKKVMPRYFCFDRVYKEFSYKKTEADPKIIKVHTKDEIINYSPSVDKNEELTKLFKWGFKIFTTTRTYILFTNDKKDYDKWMRMFNFYFYGVDPIEEKEKLKIKIKKVQDRLYYPHHEFQFYKNVSFTLQSRPKGKNKIDEIEEILFYNKYGEAEIVEGNTNNQEENKEKAILLDGYPLKENKDFNRKKINLVKRYFRNDKLEERHKNKSWSNNKIKLEKISNHSKNIDNSNLNLSNNFEEKADLFENKSEYKLNHMLEISPSINIIEPSSKNSNVQNVNSPIQTNAENINALKKSETNDDFEMVKQINEKYKELLVWPVQEEY